LINRKYGKETHSTQMGADKLAENTPNAQKFGILMKKGFIGRL
jgi:hypothetical protein